jgi:hypothetical protein
MAAFCGWQSGFVRFSARSDKSVSRETFLSDWSPEPYKASYVIHLQARPLARNIGPFSEGVLKQALDSAGGAFRHGGLLPVAIFDQAGAGRQ